MEKIGNSWDNILEEEFRAPYFCELQKFIDGEYKTNQVFPPRDKIFRALQMVDYNSVKVVILGQDPYFGVGQANGLAFAVNENVKIPPSLRNIFDEIDSDFGIKISRDPSLVGWAEQGVLLLNTSLTVARGAALSHANIGWEKFTDKIIAECGKRDVPMVFMLWGDRAAKKSELIAPRHLVLAAPHPSPLSAYRGFKGCKHFSRANDFLAENGLAAINWANTESRRG